MVLLSGQLLLISVSDQYRQVYMEAGIPQVVMPPDDQLI